MNTERFTGYLVAKTPLHHGGDEKSGATSMVRRQKYIDDKGQIMSVPIISGNSIRGNLRRLIMADLLERVGVDVVSNAKLYHLLFAGGSLESVDLGDAGKINLDLKKKVRESLPPISLLGTSIGNQMIEGKLKVGVALPVCREMEPRLSKGADRPNLPEALVSNLVKVSYQEMLGYDFQTRRDDLKADREEGEKAHQMKVDLEVVVMGTAFEHTFSLWNASVVDKACLARGINLWRERPFVGGKSGSGFGEVEIYYELRDDSAYLAWLDANKDKVKAFIAELDAML